MAVRRRPAVQQAAILAILIIVAAVRYDNAVIAARYPRRRHGRARQAAWSQGTALRLAACGDGTTDAPAAVGRLDALWGIQVHARVRYTRLCEADRCVCWLAKSEVCHLDDLWDAHVAVCGQAQAKAGHQGLGALASRCDGRRLMLVRQREDFAWA